jgi:6-phosphogluconolactonase
VRAHPNGRFVYQSNRTFGRLDDEGRRVSTGGENNIAVWRLGSTTGEPQLVQHADAASFHLRNCGIDPSGRLLVASSIEPAVMADGSTLPAALAVMRIAEDGRLDLARRIDVDVAGKLMFWSGLVELP